MNQTMSDDIPQDQVEAVSRAICSARGTFEPDDFNKNSPNGKQWGLYFAQAIAAIRVLTPMVAAVERLKLNAWMIRNSVATGHGDTIEDLLLELDRHIDMMDADFSHAVAVERERCAALCDATAVQQEQIALTSGDRWLSECMHRHAGQTAQHIAESIRSVKGAVT